MSKHQFLENGKSRFVYGQELRECSCGVWRVYDEYSYPLLATTGQLPCYKTGVRKQTTIEAIATLNQVIRNLGYALSKLKWGSE